MAGMIAGATRYPVRKFLVYVAIGKSIKFILIAYAGAYSLEWVSQWLEPIK
jgi:membrane protein DedA with SNARE-associated domain